MSGDKGLRVLLVEDNPGDVRLLQAALADARPAQLEIGLAQVNRLGDALRQLGEEVFDVVLLDLSLPDSQGIDTYRRLRQEAPQIPIVVMSGIEDDRLALTAVREGAQDYLLKDQYDGTMIVRSLRYAIERHQMQMVLRDLALLDELTGLYNRRGFLSLGQQQVKFAERTKKPLLLVFADLDGLKQINDTFGHQEGDAALKAAAEVFKETFRVTDILARLGGDEFTGLALATSDGSEQVVTGRLYKILGQHNGKNARYRLSMSIGLAWWDPKEPSSLKDLMARADAALYAHKKSKKQVLS